MARRVLIIGALLLAVSASAQTDVDWSKADPVSVLMVDDHFVPDQLVLRHGVPYQLNLENYGKELHEFSAPEFFADAIVRDPGVIANGKGVLVRPGWRTAFYLMPVSPGTFRLSCPDHDWDGMVGEIVVE